MTACFCPRCGEPTSEPGECRACARGAELQSGAVPPVRPERQEPRATAIVVTLASVFLVEFLILGIAWPPAFLGVAAMVGVIVAWFRFGTPAARQRLEARRRARRALRRLERIRSATAGKAGEGFVRIRGRVRVAEPIGTARDHAPVAARAGSADRACGRFEVVDATGSVRIDGADQFELWDPRVDGDGSVAIAEGDEVEVFGNGELVPDPSSADAGYREGPERALVLRSAPGEPVEVVVRRRRRG